MPNNINILAISTMNVLGTASTPQLHLKYLDTALYQVCWISAITNSLDWCALHLLLHFQQMSNFTHVRASLLMCIEMYIINLHKCQRDLTRQHSLHNIFNMNPSSLNALLTNQSEFTLHLSYTTELYICRCILSVHFTIKKKKKITHIVQCKTMSFQWQQKYMSVIFQFYVHCSFQTCLSDNNSMTCD